MPGVHGQTCVKEHTCSSQYIWVFVFLYIQYMMGWKQDCQKSIIKCFYMQLDLQQV